jgi:hypothetical protein
LLVEDIGDTGNVDSSIAWGTVVAKANDIIEYRNGGWGVVFDSAAVESIEYVTNLTTGIQYRWQDGEWAKSVEGVYNESEWTIIL